MSQIRREQTIAAAFQNHEAITTPISQYADMNAFVAERLLTSRAPTIFVQDVLDELIASGAAPVDTLKNKIPRLRLPFNDCWFEWIDCGTPKASGSGAPVGVYARPVSEVDRELAETAGVGGELRGVVFDVYTKHLGRVYGPTHRIPVFTDSDDTILRHESGLPRFMIASPTYAPEQTAIQHAYATAALCCFSIALMTAKGVEIGEVQGFAPSKNRRIAERLAWLRYKVMKIALKDGTLMPIRRSTGHGAGGFPLSMTAGHWKQYGINGRMRHVSGFVGHIWCPNFLRGSADNGVIVKDYEL